MVGSIKPQSFLLYYFAGSIIGAACNIKVFHEIFCETFSKYTSLTPNQREIKFFVLANSENNMALTTVVAPSL